MSPLHRALATSIRLIAVRPQRRMFPLSSLLISEEVAIKLESVQSKHPQLQYESRLYRLLEGGGECHYVSSILPFALGHIWFPIS